MRLAKPLQYLQLAMLTALQFPLMAHGEWLVPESVAANPVTPASATSAVKPAPNIVVILADDMGWNDVSYNGSEINTPNIDHLATQGVQLDRFYAQPSCTPTRTALLTGNSPQSQGIYSPMSKLNPKGLPLEQKLMPQYLKKAGYQTLMAGKWHLGFHEPEYRPTARGFDHFYGHLTGGVGYWDHVHGGGLDWQRNGETLREEGYSTHLLSSEIERLIQQRNPNQPMFLYAAFNAPHLPNEAPQAAIAKYPHIENPHRRIHAAMVSELDDAIGKLMATLESEGMLDNTLVWFMSDNGGLNISAAPTWRVNLSQRLESWFGKPLPNRLLEFIRVNSLEGGSDNLPFAKGKQSIYEGGVRVPSAIYWQGKILPGKSQQMVTVQDVLPTILNAAKLGSDTLGNDSQFDGSNQWQNLNSEGSGKANDYLVNGIDGQAFFRFPWKLLALNSGEFELYQLIDDPTEKNDVSEQYPQRVVQLQKALQTMPQADSIHVPLYKVVMDMDFFGGLEDRPPWSEFVAD